MKAAAITALSLTLLVTGLAHFPLAWVGNAIVPSTLQPQPQFLGTVWKGQVTNIDGINPVNVTLSPAKLLRGNPPLSFDSASPFLRFSGNASLGGSVNAAANGSVTGLGVFDRRFAAVNGTYDLSLNNVIIRSICEKGNGQLRTNVLAENLATWNWKGPEIAGPISCEDGQLVANLKGSDAAQTFTAKLQVDISGQYQVTVDVISSDSRAEFILPLYGFQKTNDGYRLSEAGAWR